VKTLSKASTRTLLQLIQGLGAGEARKVDNAQGAYMAVHVDVMCVEDRLDRQAKLVAIAHRFEQGGDLISDPDVEFLVVSTPGLDTLVYPLAIDQPLGYERSAWLNDYLTVKSLRPRTQAGLAVFCNTWMRNIREQQRLNEVEVGG
jgi:hypothetical protein